MGDASGRRRLEAILAADAAGYSRLMAADEDATIAALDEARGVFRTNVGANQGRVIDTAGDSVLAVFETASGAVAAAIEIQRQIDALASALAEDRRMYFRIGVHVGEVIEKPDGSVYGDGVNIAARLQALAEPGGILVSGIVQEALRDRVRVVFEDRGDHVVKNIARPVRVYRVDSGTPRKHMPSTRRLRWPVVASVVVVGAAVGAAWIATADSMKSARTLIVAWFAHAPSTGSSARASVAVMPFANHSGDPKRDYFSDGLTEDIINALGRFSSVMVMSRNAVQAYKGRPATEVSRELGVRYIAQGSVREADGKLRVVVELSDAEKGTQLWSERYEGAGAQVFEIQDRIVSDIVGALAVKLTRIEQQRVLAKPTESLEAYDLVLRARSLIERHERSANREARALLVHAEKLAPDYAEIPAALCEAELARATYGWIEDATEAMGRAEMLCKRALASSDQRSAARAHATLAAVYRNLARLDDAMSHAERAIELNASDSSALLRRGTLLLNVGRVDDAIGVL
ncbi:MAG TPA: adenylate/guanylate cyclase domain-containing protein, partial [Casimicrobiaceae bacterium]|nr:adenylate/guanylate cyclase domain-containing protein [Casimicrobiaceae bacterium]